MSKREVCPFQLEQESVFPKCFGAYQDALWLGGWALHAPCTASDQRGWQRGQPAAGLVEWTPGGAGGEASASFGRFWLLDRGLCQGCECRFQEVLYIHFNIFQLDAWTVSKQRIRTEYCQSCLTSIFFRLLLWITDYDNVQFSYF